MQVHIGWVVGGLLLVGGAVYLYTQSQAKQMPATTGLEGVDSTVGQSRADVTAGLQLGSSIANAAGEIAKAFAAGARSNTPPPDNAATQNNTQISARSTSPVVPTGKTAKK